MAKFYKIANQRFGNLDFVNFFAKILDLTKLFLKKRLQKINKNLQ